MIALIIIVCIIAYIIISAGVYAITQRFELGVDKTDDIMLLASMIWPLSVALAVMVGIFYYAYSIFKQAGRKPQ